jgi:hypothetical protein
VFAHTFKIEFCKYNTVCLFPDLADDAKGSIANHAKTFVLEMQPSRSFVVVGVVEKGS